MTYYSCTCSCAQFLNRGFDGMTNKNRPVSLGIKARSLASPGYSTLMEIDDIIFITIDIDSTRRQRLQPRGLATSGRSRRSTRATASNPRCWRSSAMGRRRWTLESRFSLKRGDVLFLGHNARPRHVDRCCSRLSPRERSVSSLKERCSRGAGRAQPLPDATALHPVPLQLRASGSAATASTAFRCGRRRASGGSGARETIAGPE